MTSQNTKEFSTDLKALFNNTQNARVSENIVKPLEEEAEDFNTDLSLDEVITRTIEIMLDDVSYYDTKELSRYLERTFELQKEIFDTLDIEDNLKRKRFVSKSGNIIAPEHCIHTIKDTLRVRSYIRSVHFALKELVSKFPGETIHIVYPACGPFAPLLLPLIKKYKEEKIYQNSLKATLIDMQKGAALTLQALIAELNIGEYIEDIFEMDALDYYPKESQKIHMVVLEALNHGFTKEGHLVLSKHFIPLMEKGGIFLPQKVTIKAFLNEPNDEYVNQWKDVETCRETFRDEEILKQRTVLGDVLTLTQENIKNLKEVPSTDPNVKLIECATLRIPTPIGEYTKQYLLFSACLDIYAGEKLGEYDSGISHPLPMENFCLNFKPNQIERGMIYW